MTRDEVMALTDEELRIKAAEAAGWEEMHVYKKARVLVAYPKEWTRKARDIWPPRPVPNYPHDIAAAWELHRDRCEALFSKRRKYLEALGQLLTMPEKAVAGVERVVAWPDALMFLDARNITRAFILAMENAA